MISFPWVCLCIFEVLKLTCKTVLFPGTQYSGLLFLYISKWSPWKIYLLSVTIQKKLHNYSPHSTFLSVNHLFCYLKSEPLYLPHLFLSFPLPYAFLATTYLFSVPMTLCFFWFVLFFCFYWCIFLDSTCKWNHRVFTILTDLLHFEKYPLGPSILSQMARFYPCLWPSNIPLYIYLYTHIPLVYPLIY